ncbi:GTP 3',8-cyclase MoaA [Candidatus Bathyarchaeota archaeon]|nr:GTP 3',8-cyclase MoaA [Candidatus Bathyarchaeota archaeon]
MLTDRYGRPVTNLRISITQRCNLACPFCHREGDQRHIDSEMTPKEIQEIVSIAASLGIDKIKLTGGEPLLRDDIAEIVQLIHDIPTIGDIGITTNGILLQELAKPLKSSGLNRVNVSLGTLRRETYLKISGVDALDKVLLGIYEAARVGLNPVKLNMVVLKGVNDDQVWDMLSFANKEDLILQLIEVEADRSDSEYYRLFHTDFSSLEAILEGKARKVDVRDMQHRRRYYLRDGGEVEIVRPMHNTEFCANCNRIRLTSDGKLKPCLFQSENMVDIIASLREGASEEHLRQDFIKAVEMRKPYFT